MYKCFICGKDLRWCVDNNLEDVYPELAEEEDGGVVSQWQCDDCHIDYEMIIHGKLKNQKDGTNGNRD